MVALEKLIVILSHRIELAFQTAWPHVVECIEDNAVDEAHASYHGIVTDTKMQLKTRNLCRSN